MLQPKQQPKKAATPQVAKPQKSPPTPAKEAAKVTDTVQQIATQTSKKGGAGSGDSTPINSGAASKAAARPTRILDLPRNVGNEVAVPTVKPMDMPRNVGNKVAVPAVKPMDMPRNVGNKVAAPAVKPMDMPRNVGNQVAQPAVKPMDLPRNVGNQVAVPAVKPLDLPSNDVQPTTTAPTEKEAPKAGLSEAEQLLIQHTPELQTAAPEVATEAPGAEAAAGKTAGKKKKKTSQKGAKATKATTAEGAAKAGVAEGEAATTAQSPSEVISSMRQQPPLKAYTDMANSGNALQQATQNSMNSTQEGMDEITISSGISAATEPKTPKPKVVAQEKAPAMHKPAAAEKVSASKETENIESTKEAGAIKEVSTAKGAFINNLKQSRTATDQISGAAQSDLGATPTASLDAASSPDQMGANTAAGQQSVANTLANAQQATTQDFGESGMFPKHKEKKARVQLTEHVAEARSGLSSEVEDPQFSELEEIEVNKQLETQYGAEMAKAQTQLEQAESDKETGVTNEKANLNTQMQTATEDAKTQQRAERAKGQASVAQQKQNWQSENQKIKGNAESKLSTEQAKSESKIAQKQAEGDQKIAETYNKADADIAAANKDADEKIAAKEKEGEKTEEKGWLDSAMDWVSEQFDKIKEAVNAVFDALRAAVKKAVAWAKEKASSIINSLRDFAVSAIKAFGELAKSIVNFALAAFPGLAKKFNALIDMAVNAAVTAVNIIASALEKAVHALIDLAGKVIDGIIAIYQKAINLALSALEFIVVGIIKLVQFLGNLVQGLYYSGFEFFGALAEEALGGNPTKPLQSTEVPNGKEQQWTDAMGLPDGQITFDGNRKTVMAQEMGAQAPDLLSKDKLSDSDVDIQPNPLIEMEPSLSRSIYDRMEDGETLDLGGAADPIQTEDLQEQAAATEGFATAAMADEGGAVADGGESKEKGMYDMSDDEKLDHFNKQMLTESQKAGEEEPQGTPEKAETPAADSPQSLMAMTGRLSVGRRLQYMGEQMITGIQVLWNKYKAWIIAGLITVLVAAVLTGGAAITAILPALTWIFGAIAVYRASGKLGEFVQHAWNKDPQKAGKALASAFAIIVMEFLLDKILLGMNRVIKRVTSTMKATKAGRFVSKSTRGIRRFKRKVTVKAKRGMHRVKTRIKNNKYVISYNNKVGKGIKKINTFKHKIFDELKLKKVWVEKHGKYLEIWGRLNPDFRIARTDPETGEQQVVAADNRFSPENGAHWDRRADGSYWVKEKGSDTWVAAERIDDEVRYRAKYKTDSQGNIIKKNHKRADDAAEEGTAISKLEDERVQVDRRIQQSANKPEVQDALSKNKPARTSRDKEVLSEHNKIRNGKVVNSREIGETGAVAAMKNEYPDFELVYGGPGTKSSSGDFDQIYYNKNTGEFKVVEAKGGDADIGSAKTSSGRAEQGTKQHNQYTIDRMKNSGDPVKKNIAQKLEEAMEFDEVSFYKAKTTIKDGKAQSTIITEFEV